MMLRTHLVVGLAAALYFLPHINNKLIFLPAVLIASALPDIGIIFSMRRYRIFKSFRHVPLVSKVVKTYTFCLATTIILAFFYPILALPFFLGYSFHLFLDAFTNEGIQPFWPLGKRITGRASKGGSIDMTIFAIFTIFDFALLIKLFI